MSGKATRNLTYGLFVVTANQDGRDNGCITNTVQQVTTKPNQISLAVNKTNLTHDMILQTRKLTVSILSQDAEFSVFQRFGFQSGRDADKFAGYDKTRRLPNGTLCVTEGTNGYISAWVQQTLDLGTHTLFIAEVTDMDTLSEAPSVSYDYYQNNIKPKPEAESKAPAGQTVWRCSVCGYEYAGEALPEDFVCPLCKHPASDFEKVSK